MSLQAPQRPTLVAFLVNMLAYLAALIQVLIFGDPTEA
jgi:hypothetical protein